MRFTNRLHEPSGLTWPLRDDLKHKLAIEWPERYQWRPAENWLQHIRSGLKNYVKVSRTKVPQTSDTVAVINVVLNGKRDRVAIDFSDYHDQINSSILSDVICYFKMQFRLGAYDDPKIIPGGYTNNSRHIYRYFAPLRRRKHHNSTRYDVVGRFGTRYGAGPRLAMVDRMTSQNLFRFQGGLKLIRHFRHLEEISSAAVVIDLPGNGDFCFRLADYLGIGACIVGPPLKNSLHVPLLPGLHRLECREDLSDAIDRSVELLNSETRRTEMVCATQTFFDKYLHRTQLAGYYLKQITAVIAGTAAQEPCFQHEP